MFTSIKTKFNLQRFFVGEGALKAPYLLTQRRVYILPTKQGLVFALLLFVMLLGSINYSNSLGYFLTFLLASLSVVTIFHTYNNLLKLSFGPAICHPVFASENANFTVKINNINLPHRYSIKTYSTEQLITQSDIPENSISTVNVKHCFKKRGLIPLPRFTVESRFPFGLFRTWSLIEFDQTQLVYPKPALDKNLPASCFGLSEGKKQLNSGTDDFKGLRSYIEGDALQHIHWKSFARHNTLQTKEFSSTSSNELWLNYVDTTVQGIELKLSQLTRWILLADKENLNYGLKLPTIIVQPSFGKAHLEVCLKHLALFKITRKT